MRKQYNRHCIRPLIFALVTLSLTAGAALALDGQAEVKLGYIYLDEDGYNRQHQSFNLYEGPALSLQGIAYRFNDGSRLTGNLRNITLNNRNLNARLTKSGLYGVSVAHSKFRRMYDSSPDKYTRRETSDATVWVKPHRFVRLFGGYGLTEKRGDRFNFFDVGDFTTINQLDYEQERYHVGVRANERGRMVEAEFRRSEFTNNTDQSDTRISERFRTQTAFPIPRYEQVFISGGFQHYEYTVERDAQEISANTGWGALRWYFKQGFSVRYSFIFNRAERTQDLVATDNLTHAVYAQKNWPTGGLTAGYRSSVRDDFNDEINTVGVYVGGWLRPGDRLKLRGEYGSETTEVDKGQTLIGDDRDFDRYRLSATVFGDKFTATGKLTGRKRQNKDIGTETDYVRATFGVDIPETKYGTLGGAYSIAHGEFTNPDDMFEFIDHTVSLDYLPPAFGDLSFVGRLLFYRSKRDADVESVTGRIEARYQVNTDWRVEAAYDARNYDDLTRLNSYYTANIVEIHIVKLIQARED